MVKHVAEFHVFCDASQETNSDHGEASQPGLVPVSVSCGLSVVVLVFGVLLVVAVVFVLGGIRSHLSLCSRVVCGCLLSVEI